MAYLLKKIIFEHVFEHDFCKMKPDYSEPKIYTAKGDLKHRWYVYFSYRNPENGKLERFPSNFYVSIMLKAPERMRLLKAIRNNLSDLLKEGLNPYDAEYFTIQSDSLALDNDVPVPTIKEAFAFALDLKKQTQAETTHNNYRSRILRFENWLYSNGLEGKEITKVNRRLVNSYLNEILSNSSARNRDNTRLDLSSLFQVLANNDITNENIIAKISIVGSKPSKNKPFTLEQEQAIFKHLQKNNLKLLELYIKFVSWGFFRPVECNRLKISDVIINEKVFRIKTKTGFKIKIIPDILLKELPELSNYSKDSFLFGLTDFGQEWNTAENNRRNIYSKMFLKLKKAVGLDSNDYGIYSFRHTYVTKVYNNLIKEMTPNEAENMLMTFTGHETHEALRKYLREINAYRPEDYSRYFE